MAEALTLLPRATTAAPPGRAVSRGADASPPDLVPVASRVILVSAFCSRTPAGDSEEEDRSVALVLRPAALWVPRVCLERVIAETRRRPAPCLWEARKKNFSSHLMREAPINKNAISTGKETKL